MKANKILIMIPAYNEEENIGTFLDSFEKSKVAKQSDVLVINDFSSDKTAEIVRSKGVKVISQIYNMGYGSALQLGYKYAYEHDYDYVLQLDADGQHDVANLDVLYEKITEDPMKYDIVIGSRFLEDSVTYKIGGIRLLSIRFFRWVVKVICGVKITDPTSGLQVLNRKAFSHYASYSKFDHKYPDVNMIVQMLLQGFKVGECEAIMHQRIAGVSMHSGIWNPMKYMILMSISTLAAILRHHKKAVR